MKKALTVMAVLATAAVALGVPTAYTGSWTQTWDFNDGVQGWTLNGSAARYATGANGTGTIYAPDTSNAIIDVTALKIGGPGGTMKPFVLQADAYVGATNYLQGSGVEAYRNSDTKGVWGSGTAAGGQGIAGNDKTWYNTTKSKSWGLAVGQWTTIQIDYGVSIPGKFTVGYTACPGNAAGWLAGSWAWAVDPTAPSSHVSDLSPGTQFNKLLIGGGINGAQAGWSQAQFDNVKLFVTPEPATLALLALGFLGLVRRRR